MDSKIMELRLKQWMPIFEEQAKSGLNKQEWCNLSEVKCAAFFKWQRELREYLFEKKENKFQHQLSTKLAVHTTSGFLIVTNACERNRGIKKFFVVAYHQLMLYNPYTRTYVLVLKLVW